MAHKRNKKGVILTLDILIAMIIVAIILVISTNYVLSSRDDVLPDLQVVRTGNDLISLFDNAGIFNDLNETTIQTKIYWMLPQTYDMKINVTMDNGSSIETNPNEPIPLDRFIGAGKRIIVNENVEFGKVSFWIWSKS